MELAEEFCSAAQELNRLVGMEDELIFIRGDKVYRALKPGGQLAITTRMATPLAHEGYRNPCPWASDASTNFLSSPESTQLALVDADFSEQLLFQKPS